MAGTFLDRFPGGPESAGFLGIATSNRFVAGAETWLAHSKEIATITLYEQRINRVLTRNKSEFEARKAARHAAAAPELPVCELPAEQGESLDTPAQPVESNSKTAAPESAAGFVHSSSEFVCSSSPIAPPQGHLAPAEAPLTMPEPLPSPPVARRDAAWYVKTASNSARSHSHSPEVRQSAGPRPSALSGCEFPVQSRP
jgi:hypothetical protein